MAITDLEREIAIKYKRITGKEPVGLIDTLRILTGPDLIAKSKVYIDSKWTEEVTRLSEYK